MKWEKLGHLFDPALFNLPNDCKEFAQAPQVLNFGNFIRVYFSTRKREKTGLFLSYIAFVDFTLDFRKVIRVSDKTVIPLGKLGCYDEHGIFPLNVLRADNKIWGFISGINRRKSVSVDSAIGVAFSLDNGNTFQRVGDGPVLCSSLHEPFLVCDPFVQYINGLYHMLYVYGKKWVRSTVNGNTERVYKIAHAYSADGLKWTKTQRQVIADSLNENECQALPTFVKIADTYHLYFCFRDVEAFRTDKAKAYRLGYATSTDLVTWERKDQIGGIERSETGWDSEMICYPHVFESANNVYMLYNGNEFGRKGFGLAKLIDAN